MGQSCQLHQGSWFDQHSRERSIVRSLWLKMWHFQNWSLFFIWLALYRLSFQGKGLDLAWLSHIWMGCPINTWVYSILRCLWGTTLSLSQVQALSHQIWIFSCPFSPFSHWPVSNDSYWHRYTHQSEYHCLLMLQWPKTHFTSHLYHSSKNPDYQGDITYLLSTHIFLSWTLTHFQSHSRH